MFKLIDNEKTEALRQQREAFVELKEMGDCHAALDNYANAERCYRQAAVLAPNEPGPFVGLGVVAMQQGQNQRATKAFQTALAIEPDCAEACAGLAMLCQEQQQYPKAFEMYLRCLEIDGDNMMALLGLFQTSCQMGTFSKIIHYLERYLETHPSDHSVLFCLSTLYAREGQLIPAKQALLTVLAGEPKKIEAIQLLEQVEQDLAKRRTQEVA